MDCGGLLDDFKQIYGGVGAGGLRQASLVSSILMERKYRLKPKRKDRVFPRNGEGFDTRSWFHPAMEEAEIAYYALHYNRHTFCSWLRLLACHTTIAITAQYAHLCPDHK